MLEALVSAALRTLLLALLVDLCLRILRVRHPQLLLAAWTAVLMASLAMPLLQRYALVTVPIAVDLPVSFADLPGSESPAMDAASGATPAVAVSVHGEPAWRFWLLGGYLIVAAAMLVRLLVGVVLSWNLVRAARPIRDAWAEGGRVRASAAICAPVTVGGSIVLPLDCVGWAASTQRAVLAHERAHVAGGDFYLLLLSQLNRVLFWFNPLSWWLHCRLASLAELTSDDAAIDALDDGPGYAAILLEMARRSAPVRGVVAMARPNTVCRRIERILAQDERQLPAHWRQRAAYGIGVAPLALATAISVAGAAPPSKAALDRQREPHTRIAIGPKLLDGYAGFYRNTETGSVMIVTREDDHLLTRRVGYTPVPEFPYTDHDFFLTVAPIQNSFVTDASGAVTRVVHHEKGQTETLERLSTEDGQREVAAIMQRLEAERAPHVEAAINPQLLDGYVGAYQITPLLVFTIARDGNKLFARLTGQRTFEVHPYSDRDFFYTIVAAQLTFVVGADGKASAVVLHQNGRDRTAERVDPGLAQTLDRKMDEQREPHTAIVQVTGYNRYPVYPYTDHDFFATVLPAQISFVTDQAGKATQLIRHQRGKDAVLNRVE
jgi:beta-lactamase regulating signal transducer with metallopeptidase domain